MTDSLCYGIQMTEMNRCPSRWQGFVPRPKISCCRIPNKLTKVSQREKQVNQITIVKASRESDRFIEYINKRNITYYPTKQKEPPSMNYSQGQHLLVRFFKENKNSDNENKATYVRSLRYFLVRCMVRTISSLCQTKSYLRGSVCYPVTLTLKDPITTTENSQTSNQRRNRTRIKDTMVTNKTITYLKSIFEISPPYCYLSRDYVKEELTSVFRPCHELHYGNDHHPS